MAQRGLEPLNAAPLRAAVAAFMGVPVEAISSQYNIDALRKALSRAIKTYRQYEAPGVDEAGQDSKGAVSSDQRS